MLLGDRQLFRIQVFKRQPSCRALPSLLYGSRDLGLPIFILITGVIIVPPARLSDGHRLTWKVFSSCADPGHFLFPRVASPRPRPRCSLMCTRVCTAIISMLRLLWSIDFRNIQLEFPSTEYAGHRGALLWTAGCWPCRLTRKYHCLVPESLYDTGECNRVGG